MMIDLSYYEVSNFIYGEKLQVVEKFLSIYEIGFFNKMDNYCFMISGCDINIFFTKDAKYVLKCILKFKKLENFS